MAEIALNTDPTKIPRGVPVRFFYDVTPNEDGTVTLGANGIPDDDDNPNAADLGYTQEGATIDRSVAREDLPVDQSLSNILLSITGQEAHLRTTMLQVLNWSAVARITMGTREMDGVDGITDAIDEPVVPVAICAVAPLKEDPTNFQVLVIYAGINVANFSLTLAKTYGKMPIDIVAQEAGRADGANWAAYTTSPLGS